MNEHKIRDYYPLWHPDTQMKTAPVPQKVISANGVEIELEHGKKLIDMVSSWWVNLHGHSHPVIAKAIYEQAMNLEQVIFADFTHEPAEKLAHGLLDALPDHFSRVFYSDDGSTAVEVALKMAIQYWRNQEEDRSAFLCFENAYHGDTFGSMSVGARSVFTNPFIKFLFDIEYVPFPGTFLGDDFFIEKEAKSLQIIEDKLKNNPSKFAGIILEPLIQGAGGMNMCRPEYLQKLEELAHKYELVVIYDEVMTGFGRTGDWFACKKAKTEPDIICLSKGITGGFLPLSATVCNERIYNAFYDNDPYKAFYHGHSYMANPLGCAAGIASLDLMYKNESKFRDMETLHTKNLTEFDGHPKVNDIRVCGTVAALTVKSTEETGYMNQIGKLIKYKFYEAGYLVRPLGNVIYFLPPYIITEEQLAGAYHTLKEILDDI
jgi:adenosylmethionine-8-amino-7-oxononanoate aminotransferase